MRCNECMWFQKPTAETTIGKGLGLCVFRAPAVAPRTQLSEEVKIPFGPPPYDPENPEEDERETYTIGANHMALPIVHENHYCSSFISVEDYRNEHGVEADTDITTE